MMLVMMMVVVLLMMMIMMVMMMMMRLVRVGQVGPDKHELIDVGYITTVDIIEHMIHVIVARTSRPKIELNLHIGLVASSFVVLAISFPLELSALPLPSSVSFLSISQRTCPRHN